MQQLTKLFVIFYYILAREKLDFAMKEVIFDLLSVGKKAIVNIQPEVSSKAQISMKCIFDVLML